MIQAGEIVRRLLHFLGRLKIKDMWSVEKLLHLYRGWGGPMHWRALTAMRHLYVCWVVKLNGLNWQETSIEDRISTLMTQQDTKLVKLLNISDNKVDDCLPNEEVLSL